MAKLIAVVRGDDYKYSKRQMPLKVEDDLTVSERLLLRHRYVIQ